MGWAVSHHVFQAVSHAGRRRLQANGALLQRQQDTFITRLLHGQPQGVVVDELLPHLQLDPELLVLIGRDLVDHQLVCQYRRTARLSR